LYPTVDQVETTAYSVPTDLPEGDGTLEWSATNYVVARVHAAGETGTGWTYSSAAAGNVISELLAPVLEDATPLDVTVLHEGMVRAVRNVGRQGIAANAISAVDIALWDLKARLLGLSLVSLLGRCRSSVPVYGSGGFTTYDDPTTADQLERWLAKDGVTQVKIKVGEGWGTHELRDLHRVELARRVIGPDVKLFVDANGGYTAHQAVRVGGEMVRGGGVVWFEEPVSSDDLPGLREVRRHLALDVTAGEYGYDEPYFERMLAADAIDCLQIDVTRCGGYTSWLRTAAMAAARNLQVSGHCAPNLHAHVSAGVPNLRHVELFHDHQRADAVLFDGVLEVSNGALTPDADTPGHGMTLKPQDAEPYRSA
jgi:L-alanine-DL-glutamate epimerase-like enolase superfamily enzyme